MVKKKVYEKPFSEVVDMEMESLLAALSSLDPNSGSLEQPPIDIEEGNPDSGSEEWLPEGLNNQQKLW